MDQTIKILAEPMDGRRCRFVVDRPLDPGRWAYFSDAEAARGSPLAERLFEVAGVIAVLIAHEKVTITRVESGALPVVGPAWNRLRRALGDPRAGADEWPKIGLKIGEAIRSHLALGVPAVSDAAHAAMPSSDELRSRVQHVLDDDVNPVVAGHGGGVEVVELIDNVIYLRMWGGCQGCGLADVTLRQGVEAVIRDKVPEIGEVFDLTDHSAGSRPFFDPGRSRSGGSPFGNRSAR
ncbi:hypothetical protein BH23PLA1_BH23PLA1_01060 [soil metagenome]